ASAFPNISTEMMEAVDKADSASFTRDEILEPAGWVLLSFLMDSRTGLGRFRDFNISNYQLMMKLIDACREHATIDQILALPDVKERVDLYFVLKFKSREHIERCAADYENTVVIRLINGERSWDNHSL